MKAVLRGTGMYNPIQTSTYVFIRIICIIIHPLCQNALPLGKNFLHSTFKYVDIVLN